MRDQNKQNAAAPYIKSEQFDTGSLGDIQDSVNLFRGDINFPFTLASLKGRNDLDVKVAAFYNSSVKQQVETWNQDAQTEILGVGWSMPFEKIAVGNQRSGSNYDDDFYVISDGATMQLYRIGSVQEKDSEGKLKEVISFQARKYQFWKISYYKDQDNPANEKWEIIKDNGLKYTYGLKSGIQWGVKWNNWIGSATTSDCQRYPMAWNLTEVRNIQDDCIQFEYENIEIPVGVQKEEYTRFSLLKKITDVYGRTIKFTYKEKPQEEISLPHITPEGFSEAYQFQYQEKLLDYFIVENEDKVFLYKIYFEYEEYMLEKGSDYKKSYLTAVYEENHEGVRLPSMNFEYFAEAESEYPGALKKITYPKGGTAEYTFESEDLNNTSTKETVLSPGDDYSPKVWNGSDYSVVSWYNEKRKSLKMDVYSWGGTWFHWTYKTSFTDNIEDFRIIPAKDFFSLSYKDLKSNTYKAFLFKKNEYQFGQWLDHDLRLDNKYVDLSITAGPDYLLLTCKNIQDLKIVQWNALSKEWQEKSIDRKKYTDIALAGGQNFTLAAYYDDDRKELRLSLYYADENREWKVGAEKIIPVSIDTELVNFDSLLSIGPSFASATFITGMNETDIEYRLMIIEWREDFSFSDITTKDFTNDKNIKNPVGFSVIADNIIGNAQHVFRYSGQNWKEYNVIGNLKEDNVYEYRYGSDFVFAVDKSGNSEDCRSYKFDPYRNQWAEDTLNYKGNYSLTSVNGNYSTVGNKIYFRNSRNEWDEIYTLPDGIDPASIRNHAPFYFLFEYTNRNNTYILFFKDGKVCSDEPLEIKNKSFYVEKAESGEFLTSESHFITYKGDDFEKTSELYLQQVINESIEEKQKGYAVSDLLISDGFSQVSTFYKYDYESATYDPYGKITQFVSVKTFKGDKEEDGYTENIYFNGLNPDAPGIDYPPTDDYTNVKDFFSLFNGQIYETKIFENLTDYPEGREILSSEYYYYALTKDKDLPTASDASASNLYGIYSVLRKKKDESTLFVFNLPESDIEDLNNNNFSANLQNEFSEKGFSLEEKNVTIRTLKENIIWTLSDSAAEKNFQIFFENGVLKASIIQETVIKNDYNERGQLRSERSSYYNSLGKVEEVIKETAYAWEKYPGMEELYQFNPVALSRQSAQVDSDIITTGIVVQTYQSLWSPETIDLWAAHKQYSWEGPPAGENFDFDKWSGEGEPDKGWLKKSEVVSINPKGLPLETKDIDGIHSSVLYDSKSRFPVARFSNASRVGDEADYYGFEKYESPSEWSVDNGTSPIETFFSNEDSYTGLRSLSLSGNSGDEGLKAVFFPENGGQKYFVYCYIKTSEDFVEDLDNTVWKAVIVNGEHSITKEFPVQSTGNKWVYSHFLIDPSDITGSNIQEISFHLFNRQNSVLLVDHVGFSPFLGTCVASVYDDVFMRPVAETDMTGSLKRTVYNILENPIAEIINDELPEKLSSRYNWRQFNDGEFVQTDPNSDLTIDARTGGVYENFYQADNWKNKWNSVGDWQINERKLAYNGGGEGSISLKDSDDFNDFAVKVKLQIDETINSAIGIRIGEAFSVRWQDSNWELYDEIHAEVVDSFTQSLMDSREFLLLVTQHTVIFFADSRRVLSFIFPEAIKGSISLFTSNRVSLEHLIVCTGPVTNISFSSNNGKAVQSQAMADTKVNASQVIYDSLGRDAVLSRTAPISYSDKSPEEQKKCFRYIDDFAYIDNWNTGIMGGLIADYFEQTYPDDYQYPYSVKRFDKSPLSKINEEGAPGKRYAVNLEVPEKERHTMQFSDGSNVLNSYFETLAPGEYLFSEVLNEDKNSLITIKDKGGNDIVSINGKIDPQKDEFTITQNEYDAFGNLVKIKLPNAFKTDLPEYEKFIISQEYDFFGRLTKKETPDTEGPVLYIHDKADRIRFMQDAEGARTGYLQYWLYDSLGRVAEEGICNSEWDEEELKLHADEKQWLPSAGLWKKKLEYDGDGTDPNLIGHLVKVAVNDNYSEPQTSVEESFIYDKKENITERNIKVREYDNNAVHNTKYAYDNLNNLKLVVYDENEAGDFVYKVGYGFNCLGNVEGVYGFENNSGDSVKLASYQYNAESALESEIFNPETAGETVKRYEYNSAGLLSNLNNDLFREALFYDEGYSGKHYYSKKITRTDFTFTGIPELGDFVSTYNYRYDYDDLGRLKAAVNPNPAWSFGDTADPLIYDPNGNVLELKEGADIKEYNYFEGTDKVLNVSEEAEDDYAYNENGNVTSSKSKNIKKIEYDPKTQMTSILQTGTESIEKELSFLYDTKNKRVIKKSDDCTHFYLLGRNGETHLEKVKPAGGSETAKIYIYGPNGLFAVRTEDTTYNLLKDHINSTRAVIEGNNICNAYNYLPLGGFMGPVFEETWTGRIISSLFAGQELDDETGLYNFNARFFDSSLGRFYSVDPEGQFSSPYVYAGNNPVAYIDPSGRISFLATLIIGVCIGAIIGGVSSAVSYSVTQSVKKEKFNIGDFLLSTTVGVVAGGLSGAVGVGYGGIASSISTNLAKIGIGVSVEGSSMLAHIGFRVGEGIVHGAIGGALTSGTYQLTENILTGEKLSNDMLNAVASGAVLGGVFGAIGGLSKYHGDVRRWYVDTNQNRVIPNGSARDYYNARHNTRILARQRTLPPLREILNFRDKLKYGANMGPSFDNLYTRAVGRSNTPFDYLIASSRRSSNFWTKLATERNYGVYFSGARASNRIF